MKTNPRLHSSLCRPDQRQHFRKTLHVIALTIALTACMAWRSANAQVTTTSFEDNANSFTWVFQWDAMGFTQPSFGPDRNTTDASVQWDQGSGGLNAPRIIIAPAQLVDPTGFKFELYARHAVQADVADAATGNDFAISFNTIGQQPTAQPASWQFTFAAGPVNDAIIFAPGMVPAPDNFPAGDQDSVETHTPHEDRYSLTYSRAVQNGPIVFTFKGEHIPEPSTLTLLGFGIFGAAITQRRRRQRF